MTDQKKKMARSFVSTKRALQRVAEYIVNCESDEYDSYVSFCDENGFDPKDISGLGQSRHVYALALIGLGLKFPTDDADGNGGIPYSITAERG